MKYLNENFKKVIESNKKYEDAVYSLKRDVDDFYQNFNDDPNKISEWGHYYFCDIDGGRLKFDINKPHEHVCEVCGKTFKKEVYDGVWVYFYRNQAVVTAWKAATVYKYTNDSKYLDIVKDIIGFYAKNYTKFVLHNKERGRFESYETMKWGSGRILPQGLNESIICIRMIQTLEMLKDDLDSEFLEFLYDNMFHEMYLLFKPQVDMIHNIRCWNNSAIGLIGFFFNKPEIIDFVFNGEFNIRRQIREGITKDGFWYEGSIHYNFFTLEGVVPLLLFSKIYNYNFGEYEESVIEKMFISAYHYAFNNLKFPNPNDGWPSINLKTYSYIYHIATKCFGEDSMVGKILKVIENHPLPRTTVPLSKPIYVDNEIALERLILNTDIDYSKYTKIEQLTQNYEGSSFGMLRNDNMNVFIKYGLNTPSHAHFDLINIEVMYKDYMISRDLSNAGYISKLCKEWHRSSLAHNTIVRNGKDIESTKAGITHYYDGQRILCEAKNVYEGVDYIRDVKLTENGFEDLYKVKGNKEAIYDYVFHLESDISLNIPLEVVNSNLGFNDNGYQHILETKKVLIHSDYLDLDAKLNDKSIKIRLNTLNKQVFILKTMDNPVNKIRTTLLVREESVNPEFEMKLEVI